MTLLANNTVPQLRYLKHLHLGVLISYSVQSYIKNLHVAAVSASFQQVILTVSLVLRVFVSTLSQFKQLSAWLPPLL